MNDNTKCFILTSLGYEEITLAELTSRRNCDPFYASKRFIALHNMLMEVSEADYKDFYRTRRRQKYLREQAVRINLLSFHALDTPEMSGEDTLVDETVHIEKQIADKLAIEEMLQCLSQLNEEERELISALYFESKAEHTLAIEYGISQQAVNKRRRKVISKLKALMKIKQ